MSLNLSNDYTLLNWRDRIWKIGPDGKLIPKLDENNQIIINPISGRPEYETIEDGTRVAAKRLNHMDNGIYQAHDLIVSLSATLRRLQVQMELDGRVPGNSGSFIDTFDGSTTRITMLKAINDVLQPVTSADTVIPVASSDGFTPMTYVTIYDGDSYEHTRITAVDSGHLTVQALTNDYSKGAKVSRSTAAIDVVNNSMNFGTWGTFSVSVSEVV